MLRPSVTRAPGLRRVVPAALVWLLGGLGLALGVLGVLVGMATAASAHAGLVSTDPPSQAELTTSPTEIVLEFDEPVEAALGGIRLYDAQEHRLDVGEPAHVPGSDTKLQAPVEERLGNGLYVVTWRALSADSHPVSGAFTFQVGSGAVGDTSALVGRLQAAQGTSSGLGNLLSVLRFVGYAALALVVGALLVRGRRVRPRRPAIVGSAGWPGPAGSCSSPAPSARSLLEGPYASGRPIGDVFDGGLLRDVLDTRYGHALVLRVVAVVVAAGLLAAIRHAPCRGLAGGGRR